PGLPHDVPECPARCDADATSLPHRRAGRNGHLDNVAADIGGRSVGGLRAQALQIGGLPVAPFRVGAQDFDARVHAAVADVHLGTGNQALHLVLGLAAERAGERAASKHDGVPTVLNPDIGTPPACRQPDVLWQIGSPFSMLIRKLDISRGYRWMTKPAPS